jgi:molecular chaperone GrpE
LPVLDNLERAENQPSTDEEYKKGVSLVYKQFLDCLEKMGVTPCGEAGQSFDPNLHNAVFHEEHEELGENVITEVLSKGFMLGDRVIRHAMVKVAN